MQDTSVHAAVMMHNTTYAVERGLVPTGCAALLANLARAVYECLIAATCVSCYVV